MKVLCVFGTRPEVIKMAPVLRALRDASASFDVTVCVTAQHREMLDPLLKLFGIRPDYDLDVMEEDQSLTGLTLNLLGRLGPVLTEERPDWVLVQGDTTTAMVAALAAFYSRLRIGHVEAGLRTGDKHQPFPEEVNRRFVDDVSDLHFAPTARARDNLVREGADPARVLVTGNTVIDALRWAVAQPVTAEVGKILSAARGRVLLVTAHRRESFGQPLENICLALRQLAERYGDDLRLIYPVHRNPNVWSTVRRLLGDMPNVTLLPPVEYLTLVHLMNRSHFVLTDSGGIQEEAPSLGKPVLVLREITERPEAIEAGTAKLAGTDPGRIVAEATRLLDDESAYQQMAKAVNPYGDGHAAERIMEALKRA